MDFHYFSVALAFVGAHQQAFLIGTIVVLSLFNKFLPGHPSAKGFFRTVLDVLLAFSPMPGAKSWLFSAVASKVGDNFAGQFLGWLSTWLNVPLSPSVPSDGKPQLEVVPPRGMTRIAVLVVLAASLLAASAARADDPKPVVAALPQVAESDPQPDPAPSPSQFGGCTASGKLCFAPSIAISIAAINLSSQQVEGAFSPGVGYGFTYNPGKWSSVGLDAYFIMSPAANQASGSVLAKFFNGYLRVGVSKGFLGDKSTRILVGPGIDIP